MCMWFHWPFLRKELSVGWFQTLWPEGSKRAWPLWAGPRHWGSVGEVTTGVGQVAEWLLSAGLRTGEKGCHLKRWAATPEESQSLRNLSRKRFHNISVPQGWSSRTPWQREKQIKAHGHEQNSSTGVQSPASTAARENTSCTSHPTEMWGHHLGTKGPYGLWGNEPKCHSLRSHYAPGAAVSVLRALTHSILTTTLRVRVQLAFLYRCRNGGRETWGNLPQVIRLVQRTARIWTPEACLLQNPHSEAPSFTISQGGNHKAENFHICF